MRDSYLEEYFTFLRFPSVSTDDAYAKGMDECAHWLVEKLNRIGLQTKLVSTAGYPVVWAKNKHQAGRKTVLLYGHYDVQPPDPLDLWNSPPFEPAQKLFGKLVAPHWADTREAIRKVRRRAC